MGHDSACCVVARGAMPIVKNESQLESTDAFSCLALPSYLESSSPSSEPSTSSSSSSELFFSVGLGNDASNLFDGSSGCDLASPVSTNSNQYQPMSNMDCGGFSSALNIPPPILEEDLDISIDELEDVDHMSENVNLDYSKPSTDEVCLSDGCCRADSSCDDDMFMSRLDELLQSDNPQEFVAESRLSSMDDLFPDLSVAQDFSMSEDMSAWSGAGTLQGLDSASFQNTVNMQVESSCGFGGEDESASQLFARWLQSNAHWISLSDLRKIKLKTSTIENATKRLGGGKKGLMLFLKFVLMWVQNSRDNLEAQKSNSPAPNMLQSSNTTAAPCLMGPTAIPVEGVSRRDAFGALESPGVLPGAKPDIHMLSGRGSSPTTHLRADWITSRSQGAVKTMMHANPNLSIPMSSSYTPLASGSACSPLSSTNLGQSNNFWFHQTSNTVRGMCPSSMSPLPSLVRGSNSRTGYGADGSSIMMPMQQQPHCTDSTPAATTRAARKSRMERQRWSVRRNRRWPGASQHHRLSGAPTSSGSAHSGLSSWSQTFRSGAQKSSYSSSQSCQQSSKGTVTMDYQQNKKPERSLKLLFHKELKQSDVGSLGRIVLPKAAETCLPPLELRDGVNLIVEDINSSSKVWNMRYRFWPNNKSRMYLLENTNDFVKLYNLKEGDYMMMYLDNVSNRYVIRGLKGPGVASAAMTATTTTTTTTVQAGGSNDGKNILAGREKRRKSLSKEDVSLISVGDSCDESLLLELIEQSLEDLKET